MISVADEVRSALDGNRPVVALESTIIAHGLPFPQNLETARELETAVRAAGATREASINRFNETPESMATCPYQ